MKPSLHPKVIFCLLKYLGVRWIAFRALYALKRKLGWFRMTTPSRSWEATSLAGILSDPFLADPAAYADYRKRVAPRLFLAQRDRADYGERFGSNSEVVSAVAERFLKGEFRYFHHEYHNVGYPPDWHRNAFSGEIPPADRHWSALGDFDYGDIKVIWELNRFSFAYTLVRAYWQTEDERYAECFWQLVENWREHNSPNQGVNWKCGQEITFRVMAWCFGLYGLMVAPSTSDERIRRLAEMIAVSGERIERNLGYALSQKNNHGISECIGLMTIGLLFPEFRSSKRWVTNGQRHLLEQVNELLYEDGSFAQYSMIYERVALETLLWIICLAEGVEHSLPNEIEQACLLGAGFLYQCQEESTGRLPLYGASDGSVILPLVECDYLDFRPVIEACFALNRESLPYERGPWDELTWWLFGAEPFSRGRESRLRTDLAAEAGGYYALRHEEGFAFIRCGPYRHRPSHADMLHVDIWWRGINIAGDAGTYSYNAAHDLDQAIAATRYHNTVTVDGRDQMERAGRFIWLPWSEGSSSDIAATNATEGDGAWHGWQGRCDRYERLSDRVCHARAVLIGPENEIVVIDRMTGATNHDFRLHWLLADCDHVWDAELAELRLETGAGAYFVSVGCSVPSAINRCLRTRGDSSTALRSPHYRESASALSLVSELRASTVWFWTTFWTTTVKLSYDKESSTLRINRDDAAVEFALQTKSAAPPIQAIETTKLEILSNHFPST